MFVGLIPLVLIALLCFIRLNVKATSLLVNAWPSFHLAPDCRLNVTVLPPLEKVYDLASHG